MKVAVTGATGYLGGGIAAAFRAAGHEVVPLTRRPCGDGWIPFSLGDDPTRIPWQGIDALVHAAHDFAVFSWADAQTRNIAPSIALFEAAAAAGVGRLAFVSSLSSYDEAVSIYGRAKHEIERRVLALGGLVVRPGLIWGGDGGGMVGSLKRLATALPVLPYPHAGPRGAQYLVHVEDASKAIVGWTGEDATARLRSLAHPEPWKLDAILRVLGGNRLLFPVPWQLPWAVLRACEAIGLRLPVRSDSLLGLVRGNPRIIPDEPPAGVTLRPFGRDADA